MNCAACRGKISTENEEILHCTVQKCNKIYHLPCTGEKDLQVTPWVCPDCRCATKRGGDNSLTPVGVTKRHQDVNVTVRQKVARMHNVDETKMDEETTQGLIQEIRDVRNELTNIREQLLQSNTLIENYKTRLEQSVSTITDYDKKLSLSVAVIAGYEAGIENYTKQMGVLFERFKKYECTGNVTSLNTDELQSKTSVVTCGTKPGAIASYAQSTTVPVPAPDLATTPTTLHVLTSKQVSAQPRASTSVSVFVPPPAIALAPQGNRNSRRERRTNKIIDTRHSTTPPNPPIDLTLSPDVITTDRSPSNCDSAWQTVQRRKARRSYNRQVVCGSGTSDLELEAVERVKKLHVCFVKPSTTPDTLKTYMNRKNPCNEYQVEKLTLKHTHYASFAVTVPNSKYEYFMSADNWPSRVEVSPWFRRSDGRAKRPSSGTASDAIDVREIGTVGAAPRGLFRTQRRPAASLASAAAGHTTRQPAA